MAEANVMEVEMVDFQGDSMKYFCHQCSNEVDPKMPGLTCPLCNSGCVEELTDNLQRDRETGSTASPNVTDQILMDLLTSQPSRVQYDDDDNDDDREVWSRSRNSISSLTSSSRRRSQRGERGLPLHSFIETVLDSLRDDSYRRFGSDFSEPRLNRYSREFRRNYGGLEDLFTQILTQLTASGPDPATQEQIDELPVVKVQRHHLESSMQCSICLENFILDEEVTSLPCNHLQHRCCIIPWLQLHATCPICRHILPGGSLESSNTSSPFRFTERNDLSLDPGDSARFRTSLDELPDNSLINLSVHAPWDVVPPPVVYEEREFNELDADVASSSDLEMTAMDTNNVATNTNNVAVNAEFGDVGTAIGRFNVRHQGSESSDAVMEFHGSPASDLTYLKDIEVTDLESELESDL